MALTELPPATRPRIDVATIAGASRAVWLLGEHDIGTEAELADTIARAISLDDNDLVLDLSMVEFMGASTISVIVRCHEFLRDRSRSLTIRSPSRPARRVLDICGLASLLDASSPRPTARAGALSTWVAVPQADRHNSDVMPIATPAVTTSPATKTTAPAPTPVGGAPILVRSGP